MAETIPVQYVSLLIVIIAALMPCAEGKTASISKTTLIIVVVVVVAVIGTAIAIAILYLCKRSKRTKDMKYEAVAMRQTTGKTRSRSHKESWEIPWANLIISNEVIAEGVFGDLYKCKLKTGLRRTNVAVAILEDDASISTRDAFHNELDLMKKIGRHRNVISLVGIIHNQNHVLHVAFEFAAGGDLRSFLRKHRLSSGESNNLSSLSPSRLLRFAVDVAKGMDYLASLDIVHKQLSASNVLLGNGLVAKISGLGLSKSHVGRTRARTSSSIKRYNRSNSFRWSAIESWSEQVYSSKSDVWSFGILLWEIVTLGGTPYHAIGDHSLLQQRLADGYRLDKPIYCTDEIFNIMLFCWQDSAEDRPPFSDILRDLHRMLEDKDPAGKVFLTFKQDRGFIHAIIDPEHENPV